MGLFVKKTDIGTHAPLYALGAEKSVLIVGLGNIGKEYEETRHNIGFKLVQAFADQQGFPSWSIKKDLKCSLARHTLGDTRVIIIKPTTFMNNSGEAVQAVQRFFKITNDQTLVVHDELAMKFGQIRTRIGGSAAGNNGVKSIIQHCGEDFTRIRVGIKNELADKMDSADFVLANFNADEKQLFSKLTREVSALMTEYFAAGKLDNDTRTLEIS